MEVKLGVKLENTIILGWKPLTPSRKAHRSASRRVTLA